jgi:hypothetical protein
LELVLARAGKAAIYITHAAVHRTGFELDVHAIASAEYGFDLEIFGRHWPRVGQTRDHIPSELLRIGLEFADGSKVTNIGNGHYGRGRPEGPVMSERRGHGGRTSWSQGYWVWPLPPPGKVQLVCEWPAADIALTRREVDAQVILDAAQRAQLVFS